MADCHVPTHLDPLLGRRCEGNGRFVLGCLEVFGHPHGLADDAPQRMARLASQRPDPRRR